ncbi:MAG: YgiQ family radical SAM protein, partial [Candidatus Omnitrophota bacterium]
MKDRKKFLPVSKQDLAERGWDACDIILVTGDAYVDHPSYGAAMIGRVLEDAGYKVGIIAQPDWKTCGDFLALGCPRLFFGITAGNLDSMVSNYTAS